MNSFRIRAGEAQELSPQNPPEVGDVIQFVGHDVLTSATEKMLQIDLVGTTNEYDPRLAIMRGEVGAPDPSFPFVILRVTSQSRLNDLIIEAGLAREQQAIENLNPMKHIKGFLGNMKTSIKNKVQKAKGVVKDKIKAGFEGGIKKIMGNNPRTHIHGQQEEAKEDFPAGYLGDDSPESDPEFVEEGGRYYGGYNYNSDIPQQDYIGQQEQRQQNQGRRRIEAFEMEQIKKDG
ncbi:hypothetical protein H072_6057 [Dactylellina haptotyla CBS 200.50]|uniref:Uncharacterized protein n=1 Tax=Dactylellina haptotyla (strain CBS 200.50) TaxID=1284197 RepID=S8BXP1_DACHA|nr:hypothetical protein H072_6057 [Dactylellina haptotyla CBS 200.50]